MNILFEDGEIIVCEKPAGASCEKCGIPGDMTTALLEHTPEIYMVHRLDTPTRGLMVWAKTKRSAASLSEQFASGKAHKEYEALVHGIPAPTEGEMEDFLFFDRNKNKSFAVKKQRNGVKKALLTYRTVETSAENGVVLSRVRIQLQTGRTHQIRVQFASRGMPLAGDGKYGAKDNRKELALRCAELSFFHPVSGEHLCFII